MKTKLCRPILLPTNDKHSQLDIDDLSVGKLTYELKQYHCKNPQQLILISLDPDEKIEEGDKVWDNKSNLLLTVHSILDGRCSVREYTNVTCSLGILSKVIATQEQIPESYIQQFIEEYNRSKRDVFVCIRDVEIEMDTKMITKGEPDYFNYDDGTKLNPNFFKPKLTNGFVTIVDTFFNLKSETDRPIYSTINKQITYTEEEVLDIIDFIINNAEIINCDLFINNQLLSSEQTLKRWLDEKK